MKPLQIILLPFSVVYYLIIILRNYLFDKGFLKQTKFKTPVISVGNISLGGTGKTPFVILLAKIFLKEGIKVSIISRGYSRNTKGLLTVFDGNELKLKPEEAGDELIVIYNHLKEYGKLLSVLVSESRVEGAEWAEFYFKPGVIILDDAFQHRNIARNIDILLFDALRESKSNFADKILLPGGNLREPLSSIKRSNIIIQNNKFSEFKISDKLINFGKPVSVCSYKIDGIYSSNNVQFDISRKDVIALSGIVDPESFYKAINDLKGNIIKKIEFDDHHSYTLQELNTIKGILKENQIIITTEKDFTKIMHFEEFSSKYPIYFLKISAYISFNKEELENILENIVL